MRQCTNIQNREIASQGGERDTTLASARCELSVRRVRNVRRVAALARLNENTAAVATPPATGHSCRDLSRRFGATRSRQSRDEKLLKDSLIDFLDVVATRRDVARDGAALPSVCPSPSIGSSAQVRRVRAGCAEVGRAARQAMQ